MKLKDQIIQITKQLIGNLYNHIWTSLIQGEIKKNHVSSPTSSLGWRRAKQQKEKKQISQKPIQLTWIDHEGNLPFLFAFS